MSGQEVQGMLIRLEATTAQLRQEMAKADSTVAQVSGRIDRQLSTVDSAFARAGQSALSAGNMVRGAMAAAAGGLSISSLMNQADAYATIASRLRLVTTSAAEFNAAQKAVFSIAQSSFQPLTATAELYQRIATNQKELKLTGEGVAGIVGTISKALAISGTSASAADAALMQLGQAFASGVLRGEELNSVMEQAPALAQAIAAGMGKTVGELRALGSEGKLTAEAVVKALQSQQKAVEDLYGKTAVTIGNSITAIGNSYTQLIGRLDQASAASSRAAEVIVGVSQSIDILTSDSAAVEESLARVSNVAETLAVIVGARLALAIGQAVIGFGAATKAAIQQAGATALSIAATNNQLKADAASAAQSLTSAQAKQADAQAALARANADVLSAQQKVASDRMRQQSEINNLKAVQTTLAGERVLEEQRLAAQITEQGRAAARNRMALARLDEVAIIKQIQVAEAQLAATTVATSAEIQAAYAGKTAAAAAFGETTLAVNAAVQTSERATEAATLASRSMTAVSAAGDALLRLMTGPVGLIAMTGAVAYSFLSLGENSGELKKRLGDLADPTDQLIDRFEKLNRATQAVTLRELKEQIADTQSQIAQMSGAMADKFENDMRGMGAAGADSLMAGLANLPADAQAALSLVRKASKEQAAGMTVDWKAVADQLRAMPGVTESMARSLETGQAAVTDLAAELDKQQKTLAALTGETEKNTTAQVANNEAQAVSGQTKAQLAEWDKYIAKLIETRDLLGANAAAEAAYATAKMGATAEQKAQAKVIAEQTDTLKKYQDAIKDNDKVQKAALKAQLVALYTQEQAAADAAAAVKKSHEDAAKAAKESADSQIFDMQRVINKAINLTEGRNLLLLPEQKSSQKNLTGKDLLTNGATPAVTTASAVTRQSPEDRASAAIAQLDLTTEANKRVDKAANAAATALKNQAKALEDLLAKSGISTKAASDMANAYVGGADNVRALTIQQEIEEELLKTGAAARDKVTAAVNALHDAEDRRDVAKTVSAMAAELKSINAQAVATLKGRDALEAFNIEKAVQAELVGKNIKVGSEEYKQLLATTRAQLDANKALEQANKANDLVDRLNPQVKLLKDYTEEQQALMAAMSMYPEKASLYGDALVKLGKEYEVNRSKATIWGQMTEAAIDRIDGAFATAWGNIGDGAESLWDNLKKGFKQTLGEIAHMLTTKPLLASISNWLTGTDNGQGLSAVWSKLLGSVSGGSSGSSGGGFGLGSLIGIGKTLYQGISALTGVGSSIAAGYASGGIGGALSGGAGYYSSMFSSTASTLQSGFANLAAVFTGATAANAAAVVGAEGITAAALSGAVTQGAASVGAQFSTGVSTMTAASYAAAEAGAAATAASLGGQISAAMSSAAAAWPLAVAMGMYQSGKLYDAGVRYDTSEVTNLDIVKYDPLAKVSLAGLGLTDKIASKLVGGKLAAILSGSTFASAVLGAINSKLFGGSWQTKDGGIQLGVEDGEFEAEQYIYQKKKGGLFSSSKKRTRYSALDPETDAVLGNAYNATVLGAMDLFAALNVQMTASVLDGLNVAATKISTKGKTQEEIQTEIDAWFTGLGDSAVTAINAATAAGLDGFNIEGLTSFVNNLYSVNASFDLLGVKILDMSVASGFAVENLINMAGGLEALNTNISAFYENFTSDIQKSVDSLAGIRAQFVAMGVELPDTRDAYKELLQAQDMSTEAGRTMFSILTAGAENASAAYSILEQRQSDYYTAFYTEAENTQRAINETTSMLKELGVALPGTRDEYRAMVESAAGDTSAAGRALYDTLMSAAASAGTVFDGLEAQASAAAEAAAEAAKAAAEIAAANFNTYYAAFYTETEKSADTLAAVGKQFAALNMALPGTRDEFRALVEGLDRSTAAGEAMYQSLMAVSGSAASAFDILETRAAEAAQAAADALVGAVTAASGALTRAIGAERDKLTKAYNARSTSLNDMLSTVTTKVSDLTGVSTDLGSALKSLRGDSDEAVKMLRAQAQAVLKSALTAARGGGSLAGFSGLEDALDTLGSNNTDLYGSMEDFARDQGRTANVIAELEGINGKQLTAAEKSQKGLETQIEQAKAAYDAQIAGLDSQLEFAQAQIDALNGVDNSIIGVKDAVQAMNAAVVAALAGQAAGAAARNTYDNNVKMLESVYQVVLGRSLDSSGLATWTAALANGTVTYDNLIQTIAEGGRLNGEAIKIPGYASGGIHGGGLRLVGENGPELEVTGPSRIYNAQQTASMLNNSNDSDTAEEVRQLRAELKLALFAIAKNTQKAAKNTDLLPQKLEQELFS
ncbi:tape measure protein [Pseudomonas capeferrum]|uniref:tape measure protein n=1 Tax=Pseudomonas capeferrum TaxID=1495066 RepID=UPI0015E2BF1C|nr:tape measure protein [Pseudomonas capeferrum]MBA1200449.1 tape measure protein [Pseudomonas capeferrum]